MKCPYKANVYRQNLGEGKGMTANGQQRIFGVTEMF